MTLVTWHNLEDQWLLSLLPSWGSHSAWHLHRCNLPADVVHKEELSKDPSLTGNHVPENEQRKEEQTGDTDGFGEGRTCSSMKMWRRDPSLSLWNNEAFISEGMLTQTLICGISDIIGDGGLSTPLTLPLSCSYSVCLSLPSPLKLALLYRWSLTPSFLSGCLAGMSDVSPRSVMYAAAALMGPVLLHIHLTGHMQTGPRGRTFGLKVI